MVRVVVVFVLRLGCIVVVVVVVVGGRLFENVVVEDVEGGLVWGGSLYLRKRCRGGGWLGCGGLACG